MIATGEGTDTIVDFEVGIDFIGLANGLTFADLSFSGDAIAVGNETLGIISGVESLTESDLTQV